MCSKDEEDCFPRLRIGIISDWRMVPTKCLLYRQTPPQTDPQCRLLRNLPRLRPYPNTTSKTDQPLFPPITFANHSRIHKPQVPNPHDIRPPFSLQIHRPSS